MLTSRRRVARFVILFTGRTGSTYLTTALNAHPQVRASGERLSQLRPAGAEAQLSWAKAYLRGGPVGRHRAVGFKTKHRDVLDPTAFGDLLRALGVRVISMNRRNHVKHAVSRITARHLQTATGRWNRFAGDERPGLIPVDPVEFEERLREVVAEKNAATGYVARLGLPELDVDYEDLLIDPDVSFRRVLEFLDVRPRAMEVVTLKNTSDDLREVISNFHDLRSRYAGTEYETMFDEVLAPGS